LLCIERRHRLKGKEHEAISQTQHPRLEARENAVPKNEYVIAELLTPWMMRVSRRCPVAGLKGWRVDTAVFLRDGRRIKAIPTVLKEA